MNRLFAASLAAALSFCMLTGCTQYLPANARIYGEEQASASPPASNDVTIHFFGFKADAMNLTATESAIHGFMENNPGIEIKYEGLKGSTYQEALELRAENHRLDDIFMVTHDNVVELAPEGALADLSDLSTIDNFSEMASSQFTEEDGSVYFLPTAISMYGMYVNLDLLKAHGFDVPVNWTEFSEQCNYFKSAGITPIIGNNFATLYYLMTAKSLFPVYQMDNTEEMIDAFNRGEVDIMEYLEAGVELVDTMLKNGWFDKEELMNTGQTSDDLALFAKGDRPFMITGGWASQRLMAMQPACTYAIYPFPIFEDGSVLVVTLNTCISVHAGSEHLEAAKSFVEYLTQPGVIYEYCDTQSCYTPLADDYTPSDETIAPASEYLSNGRSLTGTDYRLKLPLDSAEQTVGERMVQGMGKEDAMQLLEELLWQHT